MNINIIAPINTLGYGVAATNIVVALHQKGIPVSLFPIGNVQCDKKNAPFIQASIENAKSYDKTAPCLRIYHQFSLSEFVGKGPHIGFPIFELDTFTDQEIHQIESCDDIFVCSKWAADVVKSNTRQEKIGVVNLGVDREIFTPKKSTRKDIIFVNMGKWEIRKGHDILYKAFEEAFTPDDNVQLWMVNHNPFYSKEENEAWANLYLNSKMGHRVKVFPYQSTQHQIADIMREADCGIFPSRAEGWNLEALELMACGKPSIITNYSAHTEFCTPENSYLVDIDGLEDAYDGKWFKKQGKWAKISLPATQNLLYYMRKAKNVGECNRYEKYDKCIETAEKFSWENSAQQIIDYLKTNYEI